MLTLPTGGKNPPKEIASGIGLFFSFISRKYFAKEICKSKVYLEDFDTPRKTNMSPENQWLEDVIPIEIVPFLGTC